MFLSFSWTLIASAGMPSYPLLQSFLGLAGLLPTGTLGQAPAIFQKCCKSPWFITWSCSKGHQALPLEVSLLSWSSPIPSSWPTSLTQPSLPGSWQNLWPTDWACNLFSLVCASWLTWPTDVLAALKDYLHTQQALPVGWSLDRPSLLPITAYFSGCGQQWECWAQYPAVSLCAQKEQRWDLLNILSGKALYT